MKREFDYQTVLNTCEEQGETVERGAQEKEEATYDYNNLLETQRQLKKEWKSVKDSLQNIKFNLKRNIGVGINDRHQIAQTNEEIYSLLESFSYINLKMQNMSDKFQEKMNELEKQKDHVIAQFDDNTIFKQIEDIEEKLKISTNLRFELESNFEKVTTFQRDASVYEKLTILYPMMDELSLTGKPKLVNKVDREKNIAFLMNAYSKNLQMLN